ncbi:hypothetical protein V8G54_036205 [Vigna mungo]|uniref:Uncharacterized protein n=1 Tax=Vigna mungo TaxID=3915 RepID=A0AAQ3MGB4_VIGMU
MLLRNFDQIYRLYNGPGLVVTRLTNHVIGAKIIIGNKTDHESGRPKGLCPRVINLGARPKELSLESLPWRKFAWRAQPGELSLKSSIWKAWPEELGLESSVRKNSTWRKPTWRAQPRGG